MHLWIYIQYAVLLVCYYNSYGCVSSKFSPHIESIKSFFNIRYFKLSNNFWISDSFWMPRITQMSNSMRVGYPLPLSLIAESANYRSQWIIIGVGELSESANHSISLNTQRAKPTANQIFAYSIQGSWKFKMYAHPLEVFFYRSPIKPHVTVYVIIILNIYLKT